MSSNLNAYPGFVKAMGDAVAIGGREAELSRSIFDVDPDVVGNLYVINSGFACISEAGRDSPEHKC
jgi:hypothetical protein